MYVLGDNMLNLEARDDWHLKCYDSAISTRAGKMNVDVGDLDIYDLKQVNILQM